MLERDSWFHSIAAKLPKSYKEEYKSQFIFRCKMQGNELLSNEYRSNECTCDGLSGMAVVTLQSHVNNVS